MKIAILSSGRQHLLNLAVELQRLGHDVAFYSMCPPSMCRRFGLTRGSYISVFWLVLPLVAFSRKIPLPRKISKWITYIIDLIVDYSCSIFLKPCDVFIGRWFVGYRTAIVAKKKYGAKVICDIGTKHPLKENEIAAKIGGTFSFERSIRRDLKFYELADKICLPSNHAAESFFEKGFSSEKIFKNPYGANIEEFPATKLAPDSYDIIFVGNWSTQKGCDLLIESCNKLNLKLLHVGNIFRDCPFPKSPIFHHVDAVPQSKLTEYYQKAKILALPSRSDGFGMVLTQSILSGLPVIFSSETGGPDIAEIIETSPYLIQIKSLKILDLCDAIQHALTISENIPKNPLGNRDYLKDKRGLLSWEAYGKRYSEFLGKI